MSTDPAQRQPSAFVILSFSNLAADFYTDVLLPALLSAGYAVGRAEDVVDQPDSLREALTRVDRADLIVVDMSAPSASVMYLLGLAQGLLKPVVLITRRMDRMPPDLRAYQVIEYNLHYKRVAQLQSRLREIAEQAARGEAHFSSPVTDFLPALGGASALPSLPMSEPSGSPHASVQRLEGIASIVGRLREATTTFAHDLLQSQETIRQIRARGVNADPRDQREILTSTTQLMDRFSSNTEADLPTLHGSWEKLLKSAGDLIASAEGVERAQAAQQLREQLESLQNEVTGFKLELAQAGEIVARTPNINKNLNRALERAEMALGTLSTEMGTGDSYLTRTLGLLHERAGTASSE